MGMLDSSTQKVQGTWFFVALRPPVQHVEIAYRIQNVVQISIRNFMKHSKTCMGVVYVGGLILSYCFYLS
jgi:hypothetical protein